MLSGIIGLMNCETRSFSELVTAARRLCVPGQRHLLGIAGAPGAGKSTLAARLVAELNESLTESFDESLGELHGELHGVQLDANPNDKPSACQGIQSNAKLGKRAVLLPMDGYHLSNRVLEAKQLRNQKGSPATFDATGYAEMLRRLKAQQPGDGSVYAPVYHRELEEAIAAEIEVTGDIELVISEGNYLLAQSEPWSQVAQFFTEIWYLELDDATRMSRLVKRHIEFGKDPEFARQWAYGSDQRNADFIASTKYLATRIITLID